MIINLLFITNYRLAFLLNIPFLLYYTVQSLCVCVFNLLVLDGHIVGGNESLLPRERPLPPLRRGLRIQDEVVPLLERQLAIRASLEVIQRCRFIDLRVCHMENKNNVSYRNSKYILKFC